MGVNGRWGVGGDVIEEGGNRVELIDNGVGKGREEMVGEMGGVWGDKVDGLERREREKGVIVRRMGD